MSEVITVNLKIWRQEGPDKEGHFEEHAQNKLQPKLLF